MLLAVSWHVWTNSWASVIVFVKLSPAWVERMKMYEVSDSWLVPFPGLLHWINLMFFGLLPVLNEITRRLHYPLGKFFSYNSNIRLPLLEDSYRISCIIPVLPPDLVVHLLPCISSEPQWFPWDESGYPGIARRERVELFHISIRRKSWPIIYCRVYWKSHSWARNMWKAPSILTLWRKLRE